MSPQLKQLWVMALAASQLGFIVAGGLLAGLWADAYFGTSPWLAFLGLISGFATGVRILIMLVRLERASRSKK